MSEFSLLSLSSFTRSLAHFGIPQHSTNRDERENFSLQGINRTESHKHANPHTHKKYLHISHPLPRYCCCVVSLFFWANNNKKAHKFNSFFHKTPGPGSIIAGGHHHHHHCIERPRSRCGPQGMPRTANGTRRRAECGSERERHGK